MIKVIKFGAAWGGPCKALNPIWKELQSTVSDVVFESVDIDEKTEMVSQYKVKSVPTLIYLKDDIEVYRSTGLVSKVTISNKIMELK